MKVLHISQSRPKYYIELMFDYDADLKDWVKNLPGVKGQAAFNPMTKTWRVPATYKETIVDEFKQHGYEVRDEIRVVHRRQWDAYNDLSGLGLKDFQLEGATQFLTNPGHRMVAAWSTGLGKTVLTCGLLRALDVKKCLIVCPEVMRIPWLDALDKWWPDHPPAAIIEYGRKRKLSAPKAEAREVSYQAPIQIVGYSLLYETTRTGWEFMVLDEAHKLINPASRQSKAAYERSLLNADSMMLQLSATPAPTKPEQLYGLLNILHPKCWGKLNKNGKDSFEFRYRYMNGWRGEHGWQWDGLNDLHKDELRSRFEACVHRVTEADVADQLPTITFNVNRVDVGKIKGSEVGTVLQACGRKKVKHAIEWAETTMETTDSCVAIFTWHRDIAEFLGEALGTPAIHGGIPASSRDAALKAARDAGVVVATMGALGIGIDLGFCQHVLFAELYSRAEAMVQAIGRVSGFRTGGRGAHVSFLVARDTVDERVAWLLNERLSQIDELYKSDAASGELTKLLDVGSLEESLTQLFVDEELMDLGDILDAT